MDKQTQQVKQAWSYLEPRSVANRRLVEEMQHEEARSNPATGSFQTKDAEKAIVTGCIGVGDHIKALRARGGKNLVEPQHPRLRGQDGIHTMNK